MTHLKQCENTIIIRGINFEMNWKARSIKMEEFALPLLSRTWHSMIHRFGLMGSKNFFLVKPVGIL